MSHKGTKRIAIAVAAICLLGNSISAQAASLSMLASGGAELCISNGRSLETIVMDATVPITKQITVADLVVDEAEDVEEVPQEETFENLVIAQVRKYVNVRSIPSEKGEILGKLYNNSVGEFLGEEDGWYLIQSGNVTGYVKAEYAVTGEEAEALAKEVGTRFAKVECKTLKVRKEASLDSACLTMVPQSEEYLVLDETDEWAKIETQSDVGWVSKEYVSLYTEFVHAESKEEEEARLAKEAEQARKAREAAAAKESKKQNTSTTTAADVVIGEGSEMGKQVVEYALQFLGNPYVYGGTSLTNGIDCSGFVMKVYENFGVSLPHSSAADRKQGYAVDGIENAQPGDLICYSGHIGIYVGDGQIVHASTWKTGIIVSSATTKKILAIRRIF